MVGAIVIDINILREHIVDLTSVNVCHLYPWYTLFSLTKIRLLPSSALFISEVSGSQVSVSRMSCQVAPLITILELLFMFSLLIDMMIT